MFRELLFFNLQGVLVVLPTHQHTLKMETELVPEMLENLHILTQLSARKNFTEVDATFTDAQRDITTLTDPINNTKVLKINIRFFVRTKICFSFNTFAASYLNTQGLNNSCLKSRQRRPQSI